jgi:hypothetical protein
MSRGTRKTNTKTVRCARPRLPVFLGGLALTAAAHGYCREASPGLLILAALATLLATVLPRSLPGTVRAVIWGFLLAVVLGAAANIGRIVPDNDAQIGGMAAFLFDRVATFAFAVAILALFFRPSRDTVTALAVGMVPAWLLTLHRAGDAAAGGILLLAGAAYALVVVAAQVERAGAPRASGVPPAGRREWGLRLLLPAVWLGLTVLLTPPAASLAGAAREWLYGLAGLEPPQQWTTRMRASALSTASPPTDHADRVRVLMDIEAETCPGYLRESVYRTYALRQWSGRSAIIRAPAACSDWPAGDDGWRGYGLQSNVCSPASDGEVWTFRPWSDQALASLCLPGTATACAMPEEYDPLASSDGIVSLDRTAHPPVYKALVKSSEANLAYPEPDPGGLKEYLAIPAHLAPAVTNWVLACAPSDPAARLRDEMVRTMARLERHWFPPPLRRGGAETWSRWWVRVAPTVPPDRAAAYRATLEAYQDIRYRTPCDADAVRAWLAAAHRTIGRR